MNTDLHTYTGTNVQVLLYMPHDESMMATFWQVEEIPFWLYFVQQHANVKEYGVWNHWTIIRPRMNNTVQTYNSETKHPVYFCRSSQLIVVGTDLSHILGACRYPKRDRSDLSLTAVDDKHFLTLAARSKPFICLKYYIVYPQNDSRLLFFLWPQGFRQTNN